MLNYTKTVSKFREFSLNQRHLLAKNLQEQKKYVELFLYKSYLDSLSHERASKQVYGRPIYVNEIMFRV